jgi:hypothetical protein
MKKFKEFYDKHYEFVHAAAAVILLVVVLILIYV